MIPARPSIADIEASAATLSVARAWKKPFAFVLNQTPIRGQRIANAATTLGAGTLSSSVTVNSGGTLKVQNLTVSLSIGAASDVGLSAVLVAPDGTQIPLFSGLSGSNLINTVLDDTSLNPLSGAAAPYTGTFLPAYPAGSSKLSSMVNKSADGTWTLLLTNTQTGAVATLEAYRAFGLSESLTPGPGLVRAAWVSPESLADYPFGSAHRRLMAWATSAGEPTDPPGPDG